MCTRFETTSPVLDTISPYFWFLGDILVVSGYWTNEGRLDEVEEFNRWLLKP